MNITFISATKSKEDYNFIVKVSVKFNWLEWIFGYRNCNWTLIGSCTVWRYYPSFTRCPTCIESQMVDIIKYAEYNNLIGELE